MISLKFNQLSQLSNSYQIYLLFLISSLVPLSFVHLVYGFDIITTIPVGKDPQGIAYDPARGEIFVVNAFSNGVSVINDDTDKVIATIPIDNYSSLATYDSARGEIFVTNEVSNKVSVINDVDNKVIRTIKIPSSSYGIAYDPARGEIFVTNYDSDSVYVINDVSYNITKVISMPAGIFSEIAYDSARGYLYVTSPHSNSVSVINDETNRVIRTIPISDPYEITYDSARGYLYVTSPEGPNANSVSVIQDTTNEVIATIPGGGEGGIAYDSAKGYVFTESGYSIVNVINDTTNKVIATIPDSYANNIAYDSGRGLIFVTNYATGNSVSVINDIASTIPSSPTSLSATPGSGQVSLSWNTPLNNGNSPITDYIVEFRQSGTTTFTQIDTHNTSLTYTVTGLTNEASYDFGVAAVNAVGRGAAQETSVTLNGTSSVVPSSATIVLDQKVYSWTDRVHITVVAPSHNFNPNVIDTIGNHGNDQVQVCTREQCIPYQLIETGPDTGIFTGYVILTGDPTIKGSIGVDGSGQNPTGMTSECNPACGPYDGKLASGDFDGIRVSFVNVNGQPPVISSAPIRWNIGVINWLQPNYQLDGQGILQIVDPDMNLNPGAIDSFTTKVWSSSDPAGTEITMDETGPDTGIFQGKIVFSTGPISSGNMLQVKDGDTVTGQYIDRTLPQPYTSKDHLLLIATTLVGTLQPPSSTITISTDKTSYSTTDRIIINGTVTGGVPGQSVTITFNDSSNSLKGPFIATLDSSGDYSYSLPASGLAGGSYTAISAYNGATMSTTFSILSSPICPAGEALNSNGVCTSSKDNTTTSVSSSTSSSVTSGQQITYTATVTDISQTPTIPTGIVTWNDNNGGGIFSSSTCTLSGLGISSTCKMTYTSSSKDVTVYAIYQGDSTHDTSLGKSTLTITSIWIYAEAAGAAAAIGTGVAIAAKTTSVFGKSSLHSATHSFQTQQPTDQKIIAHSTPIPRIEIEFRVGMEKESE